MSIPHPIPERFADYEIVRLLGRGGMGEVYLARHSTLKRLVALKLLSLQLANVQEAVERFVREARAASKIDHPCIVAVYEAGVHEGRPFIAMRYVEGATLAQRIAQARERSEERPAPARESDSAAPGGIWRGKEGLMQLLALFERLARALHLAHETGLVHRDVKPANVLLGPLGEPVLVDFGLARLCEQDMPTLTRPGELVGTPAYMAPEQIRCQTARTDRRADVYGLGVSLYECLTLRRPFDAPVAEGLYRAILTEEPPDPRRLNPGITRDLGTVLLKTLEKDPGHRYANALELAEDLRRVQAHEPILARPPRPVLRMRRWSQRNPVIATAIAMLTIGLTVTSGLVYSLWREQGARQVALEAAGLALEAKAIALHRAEALRLAGRSTMVLATSPSLALHLALESVRCTPTLEGRNAVLAALDMCHETLALRGHTNVVHDATFSPDCERIATASADGTVRLWSAATGQELSSFKLHAFPITSVRFDGSGRRLVTASRDDTVRTWDAETGRALGVLAGHGGVVEEATFGPEDWLLLTASTDATAAIWDAERLAPLVRLVGHQGPVRSAAFTRDGRRVATASDDGTCKVWSAETGALLLTLSEHADDVAAVAFDRTGTFLVTASQDRTAMVWNLEHPGRPVTLEGHSAALTGAAFSPDGERVATSSQDTTVRIWEAKTGLPLAVLRGHEDSVLSVTFSPDGDRLLTTSHDKSARLWDLSRLRGSLAFPAAPQAGLHSTISADGLRVAFCLGTGVVEVWDLEERRKLAALPGHGDEIPYIAFDPRGQRLVSCCKDRIGRIWDIERGTLLARLEGHTQGLLEARFSPDGKLVVTASRDETARVWDAATGQELARIVGELSTVYSAVMSPDRNTLLIGCRDGTASTWDVASRARLRVLTGHEGTVYSVAISTDGLRAVTASRDTTARVWDLDSGAAILILRGHQKQVLNCDFSRNGEHIITWAEDGTARLWDASTGQELLTIGGPDRWVDGAIVLSDRREVLTVSRDGDLWRSPLDPVPVAESMRLRPLTPDERDRHEIGTADERQGHRQAWELRRKLATWRCSGRADGLSAPPCDLEGADKKTLQALDALFRIEETTLGGWLAAVSSPPQR